MNKTDSSQPINPDSRSNKMDNVGSAKTKNFKDVFKMYKAAFILLLTLILITLTYLAWNEYRKYNAFNSDVAQILENEDVRQETLISDYSAYRLKPYTGDLTLTMELLNKHQANPMAYFFFSERIVSVMYQSKVNLGNNKFLVITPAQKMQAQKAGEKVLQMYNTNKNSLYPTLSQFQFANEQHPSFFTKKTYSNFIKGASSSNAAMDTKLKQVLSRFEPGNNKAWQKYYQEVDVYMKSPKTSPVPIEPKFPI